MRAAPIGAAALGAVLLAAVASAHAVLDRAEPRVGATIKSPPLRVRLWFTHALESTYSHLQVFDDMRQRVDAGDGRVDEADRSVLTVSLPRALPPGSYVVKWRVLSIDTHVTEGEFTFTVK